MLEREARPTGSKMGFQTECINNVKVFFMFYSQLVNQLSRKIKDAVTGK